MEICVFQLLCLFLLFNFKSFFTPQRTDHPLSTQDSTEYNLHSLQATVHPLIYLKQIFDSYKSMYQFGYPCLIIQSEVNSVESLLKTTTFPSSLPILKNSPTSWKMLLCAKMRGGISMISPSTNMLLSRTKSSAHYGVDSH